MRAYHALLGYSEYRVEGACAAAFLSLCRSKGILYTPVRGRALSRRSKGGEAQALYVRVRLMDERALLACCQACGLEVCSVRRGGIPVIALRYRKRIGLLVGAVLAVGLVFTASHLLWDVRIEGGEGMSVPALRAELAECGLAVGGWIPSLDTDRIESRLLTTSGEIAWVSVNLKGTVAYVQIRALTRPEQAVTHEPANLVASCDGVIDSVKLLSGQVVVKPGELVREGQLLVSGVRDSEAIGYGISAAQGEVLARVEDTVCVRVERVRQQKVYAEPQNTQKTLFFFGKTIKLSKKINTDGQNCDIIKKMEICTLPGGAALPISLASEMAYPYELQKMTLDDEQLIACAYEQLGRALTAATEGGVLVSKQVTSEITDTGIFLTCRYECIKNIAVSRPLYETAE